MYYEGDDELDQLEHHGIKGMHWGIRRFQREDGTRTAAGKVREREDDSGESQNSGKKLHVSKKAVAVAAGVAVGAALLAHPKTREALAKYGKVALDKLPGAAVKVGKAAGKVAGKGAAALEASGKRVGNAMLDAALLSVGAVEISKLEKKLDTPEDADQATKDRNKIILDTAKAGIEAATNPKGLKTSSGSSNSGNKGGSVGAEVSAKVGAPSKKGIDKQSPAYQDLFKGQDADTRATIKSMAAAGYDIDQINKYLGHSALKEWADSFCYFPCRR